MYQSNPGAMQQAEIQRFQQQQQAVICKQTAALDAGIGVIRSEVDRYVHSLERLIAKLEEPRPGAEPNCQERPIPTTVEQALNEIHGRLIETTDRLNSTIKRIEEQVGELKILP